MKIVNIFGLVVAVHVAVLVLIFAIPGCRTSSKNQDLATNPAMQPGVAPAGEYDAPVAATPARDLSADLNPPLAPRSASNADPVISLSGAGSRQSPTRPNAASSGTAITPAPVAAADAPAQTYTVGRGDSLWSIAKKHGITVRELAAANNLRADASLQINQKLTIPGASAEPATVSAPVASTTSTARPVSSGPNVTTDAITYEVKAGDTLGAIAKRHSTTVNAIKTLNKMRSDMVRVGDKLLVPQGGPATASTPAAPTPAPTPAVSTTPAPALARAGGNTMKHVVAAGESLNEIARRYGVRIGDIALANNIADPARIRPGQELVIPGATAPAATRPPEPTRYTPSYQQPASTPASTPAQSQPPTTGTINTSEPDEVPVIRVEEPEQTIRIDPEPSNEPGPPLFN